MTRNRMDDGSQHELSAAYALDALDGDELKAYEAHLAGCERCRADVASFRETAGALAYDVDLPPVPETLERRILESARAERPNVVPLPRRWAIPAAALSVASAAAPAARSRPVAISVVTAARWSGSLAWRRPSTTATRATSPSVAPSEKCASQLSRPNI